MTSQLKFPVIRGFEMQEVIGDGGFAKVYRAVNRSIRGVAACKLVLLTPETPKSQRKDLNKEVKVHSQLKHTNVLNFIDSKTVEPGSASPYVPGVYMLLEMAGGGDLFDKIAPDVGVDEEMAQYYMKQLVSGLEFIHEQGVCHRDLKPENILLDSNGNLKISDFGLCSVFKHKGQERMLNERCGSLPYVAPELNTSRPYKAEPVDVWGVGVIFFTFLVGSTPWDEPTVSSPEYNAYLSGEIYDIDPWSRIKGDALDLLVNILNPDPVDRFTIPEILEHPWFIRPSQLTNTGPIELAQRLSQSLRQSGDLGVADPDLSGSSMDTDMDGDTVMMDGANGTQFTQTLLLFSQTQNGTRYTPHLTRFYASCGPRNLFKFIVRALTEMGIRCRASEEDARNNRARVTGIDDRKEVFKGWVEVEAFEWPGGEGSFCVMRRDKGNPISWRKMWKATILAPAVEPHVLKRRR
ncbi:hypothetical protein BOTBODRAFT_29660 [Botryobasidium botryosum FD-172 SS1]|uniref:non-specific serine/threonine protein kinase n=1 Tax=Botryobasidium botryosum (strain FD-172 SS1) TaxID=930990 RepID=A0A067MP03_BOTB1|nr:hypothetical protein BOTBODRAFT_29660 [Botryobasidium botryosum FD-172 SS1]